jgi:non-heme chloroperoxidase
MPATLKRTTLATGVALPYVEHGDPGGVPAVLLHGYSDSWRSWELLLPALPEWLHVYALTQRGHGDADRPADGYRPEDFAADVAAFMDAVGLDAAVIVGHSGGAYAAQRFALDHPGRTLALVLIGAFQDVRANPDVLALLDAVAALTDPVDPQFVREFQESCVSRPLPDGYLDAAIAESRKLPARVWHAYLREFVAAEAPTKSGTIGAPTLIVWGDQDAVCRRPDQDGLVAAIPDARLVVQPGTGHCPHWEQPAETAAEIAGFVAASVVRQSASGSPHQPNTDPSKVTMSATAPSAMRRTSIAIGE